MEIKREMPVSELANLRMRLLQRIWVGRITPTMNFYVYEDDQTKRVRVHTGNCKNCNEGKGRKPTRDSTKRWHGPYGTRAEAQAVALRLNKKYTATCKVCLPYGKQMYS